MNKKRFLAYVVNRNALKRIFFIYIPLFSVFWLGLYFTGVATRVPAEPLVLSQDFKQKIPIVYNERYNIEFWGLEKLHPFDSTKYRRVFEELKLPPDRILGAGVPDEGPLLTGMSPEYRESINHSWSLAKITELGFLRFFPSSLSRQKVLEPILYQSGGSLVAALAALERGWAINLGGGFHHASADHGEGFCAVPDIGLIVKYLRSAGKIKRAMIIDLDAHQGNGHGRDFIDDKDVFIVDIYNHEIFPHDEAAKAAIDVKREIPAFTSDKVYLATEADALREAFSRFKPDIVVYNAGTDVLADDPLGALSISEKGIIARDEMVFKAAFDNQVPVVMLFSGGYQKSNAPVIASSILNLKTKFNLWQ